LYEQGLQRLKAIGGNLVEINFQPFHQAANLLYSVLGGRTLAAIQSFFETQADAIHPVVRQIISNGLRYTAVDTFRVLRSRSTQAGSCTAVAKSQYSGVTTTGTIYTKAEVEGDPDRPQH
jgi:allophanate hydrolase